MLLKKTSAQSKTGKKNKSPDDTKIKNKSQRDLHKLITEAKSNYIEDLGRKISDPNTGSKIFWSAYKRLINNKKNTNIPPILDNGSFISNFKEKAVRFNKLFAGYCTIFENDSEIPSTSTPLTNNILGDIDVRIADIGTIIENLNPKKVHGIDGISIELI